MDAKRLSKSVFLENKYANWYWAIIESAQQRKCPKNVVLERHHILPKGKYLFPQFKSLKEHPWNGVYLTLREHYICHLLLTKMTTGETRRATIYALMRFSSGLGKCSSRHYAKAKELFKLARRGCPSSLKGRPGRKWTDEQKQQHSKKMKEVMNTKTTKQRCSVAKMGKPGAKLSKEHREAISHAQRNPSNETRAKKSAVKIGANNPMFGKTRITNDGLSFIWVKRDELHLYPGYYQKGRTTRSSKQRSVQTLPE